MPSDKNTGLVIYKENGIELRVPTGTKLKATLKVCETVKQSAIKKWQPGSCNGCHSGRDWRISEVDRVLPAKLGKNMSAFDLKTGKLTQAGQIG